MVWAHKLKNLTALNWACIGLLILNLIVLPVMFMSEAAAPKIDYPTLEVFASASRDTLNVFEEVSEDDELKKTSESKGDVVETVLSDEKSVFQIEEVNKFHIESNKFKKIEFQRMCYEIGPIASSAELIELQSAFEVKGVFASVSYRQSHEDLGYWVFIPALRSRALGRLKVEELRLKGFRDAVLLTRNEPVNAVSLGVLENQKSAHKLLLEAQSFGFNVKMDVRSQGIGNAWLVAEFAFQRGFDEVGWFSLLENYPHMQKHAIKCFNPDKS